jgi:hypothetical protein
MIRMLAICAASLLVASSAAADSDDCRQAVDQYNYAIDNVSSTLDRYANCVSGSRGQDDCSSEFRRLKSAHSDFESHIYQIRNDC